MQGETLRIHGYREFLRACDRADRDTKRFLRDAYRQVAEPVRAGAAARFVAVDARSASGYRTVVRQRGVAVEQRLRRTTGRHPEFGALQMRRALVPSLRDNEQRTVREFERALDRIADRFEAAP